MGQVYLGEGLVLLCHCRVWGALARSAGAAVVASVMGLAVLMYGQTAFALFWSLCATAYTVRHTCLLHCSWQLFSKHIINFLCMYMQLWALRGG
jgi:hypothetical protein